MKTTEGLMRATTYKSGKPVYKGAILGRYASTYHQTVTVQPQISNGGRVVLPVDSQLKSACEGLQKGQIGARKHSVKIDGKTTIISEHIAECYDLDQAREASKAGLTVFEVLNDKLSYKSSDGRIYNLKEIVAARNNYRENNSKVRERIENLKKAYKWRPGMKMDDQLMQEITESMKDYISLTGFDLVVTFHDKHAINKTQDYVSCSDETSYRKLLEEANYNDQGNRLVARSTPIKVVIPIQAIEQVNVIKETLSWRFTTTLEAMSGVERVASDALSVPGVDIEVARKADQSLNRK